MRMEEMVSEGTVRVLFGQKALEILETHPTIVVRKDGYLYGLFKTAVETPEKILAFTIDNSIHDLWVIQGHEPLFDSEPGPRARAAEGFFQWLVVELPPTGLKYQNWIYKMILKLYTAA